MTSGHTAGIVPELARATKHEKPAQKQCADFYAASGTVGAGRERPCGSRAEHGLDCRCCRGCCGVRCGLLDCRFFRRGGLCRWCGVACRGSLPGSGLLRSRLRRCLFRYRLFGDGFLGYRFLRDRFLRYRLLGNGLLGWRFLGSGFLRYRFLGDRFLGWRFLGWRFLGSGFLRYCLFGDGLLRYGLLCSGILGWRFFSDGLLGDGLLADGFLRCG